MKTRKATPKEIADAKKLQDIAEALDESSVSQAQKDRKKLFRTKVLPIPQYKAKALRAAQDKINDETLIPKSPNPLADMARALHKCFQCGIQLTANEQSNAEIIECPGLIVVCQHCLIMLREWENLNGTATQVPCELPYAASQLCADEYANMTKTAN